MKTIYRLNSKGESLVKVSTMTASDLVGLGFQNMDGTKFYRMLYMNYKGSVKYIYLDEIECKVVSESYKELLSKLDSLLDYDPYKVLPKAYRNFRVILDNRSLKMIKVTELIKGDYIGFESRHPLPKYNMKLINSYIEEINSKIIRVKVDGVYVDFNLDDIHNLRLLKRKL